MPAPGVSAFGDGSHAPGATGITVDGGGFGAFPGSVWIYENADLTGDSDELTVVSWDDIQILVDIPGSLNNAAGTRYLFVLREDLAWSNGFEFTLEAAGSEDISATGSLSISGAADLDARGSLVAAGAASITGAADLDARGSLAAAGVVRISGVAELTDAASQDIAAVGSLAVSGVAALNAPGRLTAAGALSIAGAADLEGNGVLRADGSLVIAGSAVVRASGQISAAGQIAIFGAALLVDANAAVGYLIGTARVLPALGATPRVGSALTGAPAVILES